MEQTVDQLMTSAEQALNAGDNDLAAQLCAKALDIDPESLRPHLCLAQVELNRGSPDKTLQHIEIYLEKEPEEPAVLMMRAWILYRLNQITEGKKTVDFLLQVDPDYEDAHHWLAYYYFHEKKDLGLAEKHLKKAQEQNPHKADYLSLEGDLAETRGNYEKAESLFKEALQKSPESDELLHRLGKFYLQRNRYAEAQELITKALRINPEYELYQRDFLLTIRNSDQALEAIKKELEASTSPKQKSSWYTLEGHIYRGLKKKSIKARDAFERALEQNPENQTALFYSGTLLAESIWSTNKKKAAQRLRQAYKLNPTDMLVCTLGAYHLAKLGHKKEAEEMFQQAFTYDHDRWILWTNYALYLLEIKNDVKKSLIYFKKAYEDQPDEPVAKKNYMSTLVFKSPLYAAVYNSSRKIKSKWTWKILHWLVFLILASQIILTMESIFLIFLSLFFLFSITRYPHWLMAPFLPLIRKRMIKKEGLDL